MKEFLRKYQNEITGSISGWDRIAFRGTIRWLANLRGIESYMYMKGILLKDFGAWAEEHTKQVRAACVRTAESLGIEQRYLNSSTVNKEAIAKQIAFNSAIKSGPICMLSVVEPSYSPTVCGNRARKKLELTMRHRRCVWIYYYWNDEELGFGHLRLQTWLPFTIKGNINGREWLGRQMNAESLRYKKSDNCFRWISDVQRAQELMEKQLEMNWRKKLEELRCKYFSVLNSLFGQEQMHHYWSADETEWATDVMFKHTNHLDAIFPSLIYHGLQTTDSANVLRFLGKIDRHAELPRKVAGDIRGDRRRRYEGIRVKHSAGKNSIKMYNKAGNILRVETTINDPRSFKVFRRPNDDQSRKESWQNMRKGVADIYRRSQISQRSNERYLDSLTAAKTEKKVQEVFNDVSRRVTYEGRKFRALNLFKGFDYQLLAFLSKGEWNINGFRNRDLRNFLYDQSNATKTKRRRLCARTSRHIRMLRAHGLVRKVSKTHRYVLTRKGQQLCPLAKSMQSLTAEAVMEAAA